MRLGIVRGHVVLTPAVASYRGMTLVVLEPVTMENLRARNGLGGGKSLVAVDELGAAKGQMVAFTEGREAANPFWPDAIFRRRLFLGILRCGSEKRSEEH
jgi:microcompartment protein CcmK/EutM